MKRVLSEEATKRRQQVDSHEEVQQKKKAEWRQESAENYQRWQNQARAIEQLMFQKRQLMFQLSNEVKRNGLLVRDVAELQQTIHVQRQMLHNLGIPQSGYSNSPSESAVPTATTTIPVNIPKLRI